MLQLRKFGVIGERYMKNQFYQVRNVYLLIPHILTAGNVCLRLYVYVNVCT